MKLVKFVSPLTGAATVGMIDSYEILTLDLEGSEQFNTLADLLEDSDIKSTIPFLINRNIAPVPLEKATLLPPIDRQEVWAAGVTYRRSQQARMEESDASADCYDRVYEAARPELFMKATPHRVVGPNQPIRIRQDSKWNVPEPELALVLTSGLQLVGFTIGNDMSSRDIEGENPLYLPQAKVYDHCCGLGPCITLSDVMPAPEEVEISLKIHRKDSVEFEGTTNVGNMARSFDHLIDYLGRDSTFPNGAFLLTGTGIIPPNEFTLEKDDRVEIEITGIGTLVNTVTQG